VSFPYCKCQSYKMATKTNFCFLKSGPYLRHREWKEMRNQRIQGTEKCYIILQHLNVYNVYSLLLWDLVYLRSFLKNTDFGSSEHGSSGKSHVQGLKFKLCYCSPKLKSTKNKNWLRAGGIALGCNYCVKFWIV
jgi:hypothetical protein